MGVILSFIREAKPAKSTYDPERDMPDLSGKVVIVTGGNTGIGYEITKHLLKKGARVYLATRDSKKSRAAIERLQEETGQMSYFIPVDLADLNSVKVSVEEFKSKERELHILFNNAGVMEPPMEQTTKQGHDMQFGVNVLGHYYFTRLLLPLLFAGAKSSGDGKARVVNLSSSSHLFANCLWWDTFEDGPARRVKTRTALYNQSKFGNVVFSHELARRYGDQGIVSTALNPGIIRSELQRYYSSLKYWVLDNFLLFDTPYGALTPLYAGTAPEGKDFNGKWRAPTATTPFIVSVIYQRLMHATQYLIPWARIGNARSETLNRDTGEKLWAWLEEKTKDY